VSQAPWAQNALNFEAAWQPGNSGSGVTVAVVDSGVSVDSGVPGNSQLAGKVDGIDLTNTVPTDCDGHGTGVAGIIAASNQISEGNAFAGVAPAARILSVKVTVGEGFSTTSGTADLAQGIIDAAVLGAKVISVSVQGGNSATLANAVAFAESKGAVIVAAGGNDDQPGQPKTGPYYPASYPGVLSVGSLDPDGSLDQLSDQHSNVRVTAPGADITSLTPGGFNNQLTGTSFATPFVAGVAALVIASHPQLSAQEVIARIVDTADGSTGPGTGAGMVNPLQAVTAVLPPASAQPSASTRPQSVPVAGALPPDTGTRDASLLVTLGSVAAAVLVIAAGLVIGPGRRRRWRPGAVTGAGTESAASAGPQPDAVPAETSEVLGW
jgi:type VII secretion-associated serine protease mycosin